MTDLQALRSTNQQRSACAAVVRHCCAEGDRSSPQIWILLRYGSKVIDFAKGKNSVEVSSGAELITVLETLKSACELGELDQQIGSAADAVKARFGK